MKLKFIYVLLINVILLSSLGWSGSFSRAASMHAGAAEPTLPPRPTPVPREESQSNENVQQPIQQIEVDQPRGRFSFRKPKPLVVNVRLHRQIAAHDINYRQGVPIMFLGTEDMIPKYLADEFTTRIVRNPQMVEAVLGKEVAAAELEALKMTKKTIKWLIIAGIIMSLIGVGISYITLTKVQAVGDMVYNLTLNLQPILSAAAG